MQAYNKIGFHTSVGGNPTGIGDWMKRLDAAGIPFFIKATDSMTGLFEAQALVRQGEPGSPAHTAVFRRSVGKLGTHKYDVPDYTKAPEAAASEHWQKHEAEFPPELDRAITWVEIYNELRKEVEAADWIGHCLVQTATIALGRGYRFAGPGYSTGTPEIGAWETPGMLRYLRLCAEHPDRLGVALHEYSLRVEDIRYKWGYHIGRFRHLFAACDKHGIPRPKVLITEWGWTHEQVPDPARALEDIALAAELYAAYPEVLGAATWYLGQGFGGIADRAQKLIKPVTEFSLSTTFEVEEPQMSEPRVQYRREYWVVPATATEAQRLEVYRQAAVLQITTGPSYDDAGLGVLNDKTAVLWGIPDSKRQEFTDWYGLYYPGTKLEFRPLPGVRLVYRPCQTTKVNRYFGERPDIYQQFGLPGHEGLDYAVPQGGKFYAAAAGRVVHASDRRWSTNTASAYGWHVVVDHGDYCTVYAHAAANLPVSLGQNVAAGQVVGVSGNTGNSTGYHEHFMILDKTGTIDPDNGYPNWRFGRPVDPWPHVQNLPAPPDSPPPPAGEAAIGLHMTADGGDGLDLQTRDAEAAELAALAPGVVKFLSSHSDRYIGRMADAARATTYIIRAFLSFRGRTQPVTPQQFVDWTAADVDRALRTLRARGVALESLWIELHNEPNLTAEGLGVSWQDGASWAAWASQALALYRGVFPGVKIMSPGLSPGRSVSGVRLDSEAWTLASADFIRACDGIGVHAYWVNDDDVNNALAWVDKHVGWFSSPLWVTEASFKSQATAAYLAGTYFDFWQALRQRPQVQGVTYFVSSASNEAFREETWVRDGARRGIAAGIQARK